MVNSNNANKQFRALNRAQQILPIQKSGEPLPVIVGERGENVGSVRFDGRIPTRLVGRGFGRALAVHRRVFSSAASASTRTKLHRLVIGRRGLGDHQVLGVEFLVVDPLRRHPIARVNLVLSVLAK